MNSHRVILFCLQLGWSGSPLKPQDSDFQQAIFSFVLQRHLILILRTWCPTLSITLILDSSWPVLIIVFYTSDLILSNWASSDWTAFGINFSNMACRVASWQPHHTTKAASMGSWPSVLNSPESSTNGSFLLVLFLSIFCLVCLLTQQNAVLLLNLPSFPISGII